MQWQYEDQLPPMTDDEYRAAFPASKVIDGVRMFPMLDPQTSHAIGQAIGKLTDKLTAKQVELERCEKSQGRRHNVLRMNTLRKEIASLERRISLAESVQDRMTP